MANSKTRKVIQKDIVSKLPRNLQETILDLLPIRDAVRTSIVSKRWRYFWTTIPRLIFVFDDEFLMSITPILNGYQDPKLKTRELLNLIDKILRLHSGPLLMFSVKFLDSDSEMICDQIKQWIPLLSRKCVKELTLQNFHSIGYHVDLHPNTFSSLKLSHLKLRGACLTEPGAFTYLTNLKLVSCCVPIHSVGECIFKCPLLERLTLARCFGLYHTNFHAPNLKSLYLEAFDIALEGLKTITDFAFCLLIGLGGLEANWQPSKTYNVATLLGCLHKVEKLTIGYYSLQHLAYTASIPQRAPEPLSYLKDLIIDFVDFANMLDVTCIIYIISSAPYLYNLEISGRSTRMDDEDGESVEDFQVEDSDGESVENFQVEDSGKCNLDHLEYVEFSLFRGFRTEMELIKFIAARSPLLKEMYIHYTEDMKTDEVAQEIKEFAFASPIAQICFDPEMPF